VAADALHAKTALKLGANCGRRATAAREAICAGAASAHKTCGGSVRASSCAARPRATNLCSSSHLPNRGWTHHGGGTVYAPNASIRISTRWSTCHAAVSRHEGA